jgi:hypothetical protein
MAGLVNTTLEHAYLCVRALDVDGLPVLPGAWSAERLGDTDWYECRSGNGQTLVEAYQANVVGAEALFALFGPLATLDAFAASESRCMPAREAWNRRAEASVRAWLRYWRCWRFDGYVRENDTLSGAQVAVSGVVRTLTRVGQRVPDPTVTAYPWLFAPNGTIVAQASQALYRIDTLVRPALLETIGGYELHAKCEAEPART